MHLPVRRCRESEPWRSVSIRLLLRLDAVVRIRPWSLATGVAVLLTGSLVGPGVPLALGASWSAQPFPVPPVPSGQLAAVACPSVRVCAAVGSYSITVSGAAALPLAESWNGTAWMLRRTPKPRPATTAELVAISCSSKARCMAVGSYTNGSSLYFSLAGWWNGTGWSIKPVPRPPGADVASLSGVSCVSARWCVAVGSFAGNGIGPAPLVEQWNGKKWRTLRTPLVHGAYGFTGVSCTSTIACMAVGSGVNRGVAEWWDGARWSVTPSRVSLPKVLSAVSCTSASACTAVGAAGAQQSVLRWDGSRWARERTPPVCEVSGQGGCDVALLAVSCRSRRWCVAVGSVSGFVGDTEYTNPLVERWNGNRWSVQAAPTCLQTLCGYTLDGVSCASSRACTAVGSIGQGPGANLTVALRWNGRRWMVQESANGAGNPAGLRLTGVSCSSTTSCVVVGLEAGVNSGGPIAEAWNGTRWSIQPSPAISAPSQGSYPELSSVSCASAIACTAVGSSMGSPLIERWNGTSWTIQSAPASQGGLSSVSCPSATACTAVGGNLAATWDGNSWTFEQPPNPAGISSVTLNAVSCSSPSACIAVGQAGSTQPLAERWDGSSWTVQPTPTPGTDDGLMSVSCSSSTWCLAVGTPEVAESWNGANWSLASNPPVVLGVFCTDAASCMAVGGGPMPQAAAWNGLTWSTQQIPLSTTGVLVGVSCTSPTACTAVGNTFSGPQSFIEHYS